MTEERRIEESDWYDIMWFNLGGECLDILIKEKKQVVRICREGVIVIEEWNGK